jgi:Uma2 family endonuclease
MGMPIANERRWSVDDVWALPDDGNRYETVDGELLVSPTPRFVHQRAVARIGVLLSGYVTAERLGEVLWSPYDVVLDPFTLVQPDILVIAPVGPDVVRGDVRPPVPFLAIEVLSPSTARADRLRKRPRYQKAGIECWLVDLDSELIERWTVDAERPEVCGEQLVWSPPGARSPFVLEVAAFMRQVLGPVRDAGA